MGDIASLKIEFFVDQFGPEGKRIWELCSGIDDSPIVPLEYEESILEHLSLPFYSTSLEVLNVAVDSLLKRAYFRPRMRGKYVAKAQLQCTTFNGPYWEKPFDFKHGIGSWERASFAIKSQLELDPPQSPIEDVTLTLSRFTNETGTQSAFLRDVGKDRQRELVEVDQRLRARMKGEHALYKVVEVAPWHPVPEMRALQVPIDPSGNGAIKPLYLPSQITVKEGKNHTPSTICLKRRRHEVVGIEDLWTLDLWWLPEPIERTYFQVTGDDCGQVTIFRDHKSGHWYQQSY